MEASGGSEFGVSATSYFSDCTVDGAWAMMVEALEIGLRLVDS